MTSVFAGDAHYTVGRFLGLADMAEDNNNCWRLSLEQIKAILIEIAQEYREATKVQL